MLARTRTTLPTRPGAIIGYGKRGPIRLIAGGSQPDQPPTPPTPTPPPAPADRTFTQDDLSRVAAREKDQGRREAVNELAQRFGMSIEDAEAALKAHRAQQDAAKSEAEKAREAADREKTAAETAKAQAAAERHAARVERALIRAGLSPDNAPLLDRTVLLVDAPHDADDAALKAAVEKLKTEVPALFGPGKPAGTPGSDPGTPRPGQQVREGEFGTGGAAEAQRRFGRSA